MKNFIQIIYKEKFGGVKSLIKPQVQTHCLNFHKEDFILSRIMS